MKDKIEQLYISAIQGEWDSAYFAEQMMLILQSKVTENASAPEYGIMFWKDNKYYSDVACTKLIPNSNYTLK